MHPKESKKRYQALRILDENRSRPTRTWKKRATSAALGRDLRVTDKENLLDECFESDNENKDEIDLTQILEVQLNEDKVHVQSRFCLNKDNLKKLQVEILKREEAMCECGHYLCSTANKQNLTNSRLWFLFELEVSYSGVENLRNGCYWKEVYQAIDQSWKVENLLNIAYDSKTCEPFSLEELIIPTILNMEKSAEQVAVDRCKLYKTRKIPPSLLSSRNRHDIFDLLPVKKNKALETKFTNSFETLTGQNCNDGKNGEVQERCCILKDKLKRMNGSSIPKVADK